MKMNDLHYHAMLQLNPNGHDELKEEDSGDEGTEPGEKDD